MIKTIEVNKDEYMTLEAHGGTPLIYKRLYNRDYMSDIFSLVAIIGQDGELDLAKLGELDGDLFYRLLYTFAYTHNPSVGDDVTFFSDYSGVPLMDIMPTVMELIYVNLQSKKN